MRKNNDIFKNLKTLDEMKDVCDEVTRGHIALNSFLREVRKDWDKYEADILYQKVYNKYGTHHKPMPLKFACILESRKHAFPTTPHR